MSARPSTRVCVTLLDITSPIHGEYRGQRLVAALPNAAGPFGKVSWLPPYLVLEVAYTGRSDTERFVGELDRMGYHV